MDFLDQWLWLIFVAVGLLLVLVELIIGIETGLDLVFIGSAFILGGLVTWPFATWLPTVIVTRDRMNAWGRLSTVLIPKSRMATKLRRMGLSTLEAQIASLSLMAPLLIGVAN